MLRFFINAALPSILIMVTIAAGLAFWVSCRLKAYAAARRDIRARRKIIQDARDALAAVIAEGLTSDEVREQVLPAYRELTRLLTEREEITR